MAYWRKITRCHPVAGPTRNSDSDSRAKGCQLLKNTLIRILSTVSLLPLASSAAAKARCGHVSLAVVTRHNLHVLHTNTAKSYPQILSTFSMKAPFNWKLLEARTGENVWQLNNMPTQKKLDGFGTESSPIWSASEKSCVSPLVTCISSGRKKRVRSSDLSLFTKTIAKCIVLKDLKMDSGPKQSISQVSHSSILCLIEAANRATSVLLP